MTHVARSASYVAAVVLLGACMGSGPRAASSGASDETALRRLEDQWADAYVRHDPVALERILAPDFVMSRANATTWSKADYMAHVRNDTLRHASITRADERIRLYGDAAVVTYRPTRLTEGRPRTYRSTDTFIRQDGRWLLVARHITEVPGTP
jgi:hypothetical protein